MITLVLKLTMVLLKNPLIFCKGLLPANKYFDLSMWVLRNHQKAIYVKQI